MKVLYLPIGAQPATERGFRSLGVDLMTFDFCANPGNADSGLLERAESFKPDLIHMQLQMTGHVHPNTIVEVRRRLPKVKITNWTGDIRVKPNQYFIDISKVVDVALMSNVGQIEDYRNSGCKNPVYWQIGYDDAVYFPMNKTKFRYDVAFIGNHYTDFPDSAFRFSALKALKSAFGDRCGIFGNYPDISNGHTSQGNEIYNNSVCALSISNFNDVSHYFSDRLLMCVASGRPTISYRFPCIEDYFINNSQILIAYSIEDIIGLVNKCKANIEWANEIGRNGAYRVAREHNYTSRVSELFKILSEIA